jgi:uncharacterized Zn-finger protein
VRRRRLSKKPDRIRNNQRPFPTRKVCTRQAHRQISAKVTGDQASKCSFYITHTISEDGTGTADEVMSKRLAVLTENRHHTNRTKKNPCRKYAWGEIEPASSADEPPPLPFLCDQCPQSFNRKFDLTRHKRIHLAVEPFPCAHCDIFFSRKDALKVSTHLRAS